ncbi:MAG: hypothetical protein LLG01_06705 [Planctomycetaceae bacterium]|nr:hypothetical protein [Planctomycetaceae bacterium]
MKKPATSCALIAMALCMVLPAGCGWKVWIWNWDWPKPQPASAPASGPATEPAMEPVPLQQSRAYSETVTGRFVSLCDFEDSPDGPGHRQMDWFTIAKGQGAAAGKGKFVVNITRTGAGAMEVSLLAGARLVFTPQEVHDFSGYTLLSMALYSEALRDDLRVTLRTDKTAWTSPHTIVQSGWNTVLIDIQRLARVAGFDTKAVRAIEIAFVDAAGQVTFNIDDIMLIDNRRAIEPTPRGIKLLKSGLDYTIELPGRGPMHLSQSPDGLWRLGADQPVVSIAAVGQPAAGWEDLEPMGPRRVGSVELIEHNASRLRIANIWYFPTQAGEWASLAVRQIRWDLTFYADGRAVTGIEVNNAGGRAISALRIHLPATVAWSLGKRGSDLIATQFPGPVARWSYLQAAPGERQEAYLASFLAPGSVQTTMGQIEYAAGDIHRDGFDESQGCYYLKADAGGHCRFTIAPPPAPASQPASAATRAAGVADPVFLIAGPWKGPVRAQAMGRPITSVTPVDETHVLFVLPENVRYPVAVEVTGEDEDSSR